MIRVLHVVSSLGTGSGMMSVLMSYYRTIDREQIQFDFLSFRDTEKNYEEEILSLGGRVYHCSKPGFNKKFKLEMNEFFSRHQGEYTILHCHPIHSAAIFAPFAKKYGFQHVISHSHSTKFSAKRIGAIRNFLIVSLFGKRATDYIACSEKAKELFFWKKREDIFLLNNAIDTDKFCFSNDKRELIRKELNVADDEVIIGHIGRFAPEKNHVFILNMFKEYQKLNDKSKLLLVGDGPLFDDVQQKAVELNVVDNVLFVGRKSNIPDYLSAMDIFILPSLFEGLPISLVEAQVSGLHCVTSTNVPHESDITGKVTFLELKDSIQNWINEIHRLSYLNDERPNFHFDNPKYDIYEAVKTLENYYKNLV